MKVLVTGGWFDDVGDGVVWEADFTTGTVREWLRWQPPPHLQVPGKGFAGGCIAYDDSLHVAAHAAVVRIDLRRAAVTGLLHQPCMNDLHHVEVIDRRLYVVNTGLGAVDVFEMDGSFVGSHAVLPAWANQRRLDGADLPVGHDAYTTHWEGCPPAPWPARTDDDPYWTGNRQRLPFHRRKIPDPLHLNHVALVGGRLVATCFADGSLRDLGTFRVLQQWPDLRLHDGVVHGGALWLSAIDGTVLEVDPLSLQVRRRLSVFTAAHYGWCRGLAVTDAHLVVGLTEVRKERMPRHRWAGRDAGGSMTGLLLLDRRDGALLACIDMTDAARQSKLYSLLNVERT